MIAMIEGARKVREVQTAAHPLSKIANMLHTPVAQQDKLNKLLSMLSHCKVGMLGPQMANKA
jgi:hypothetical protein